MAIKVLIVDDHPSFRASARMLLECEGYEVVGEAADGKAALAEVARLSPDVVLLDVGLPDLDGFEVDQPAGRGQRRAGGGAHVQPRDLRLRFAHGVQRSARLHPEGRAIGRALEALL